LGFFDQNAPLLDLQKVAVFDAGDIDTDPATPGTQQKRYHDERSEDHRERVPPLVLGGDDSVPIPVFAAYEGQGEITIIQIDAHLDWKHERNGLHHTFSSTMRRASEMPWVKEIIQAGLRGIGLRGSGVSRRAGMGILHLHCARCQGEWNCCCRRAR
jgi:agmatinase